MVRRRIRSGPDRAVRLADQIQKDLAGLIQREFEVAQVGLITLSGVELSADYAHAKVYFTVLGAAPEAAAQRLNERAGWLHSQLFRRLHIHTVPTLRFIHDIRLAQGIALVQLIDEANRPEGLAPEAADPASSRAAGDPDPDGAADPDERS